LFYYVLFFLMLSHPTSLLSWDNSTNTSDFTISECHYPTSLRSWDNSTSKLQRTTFLKFGSHYKKKGSTANKTFCRNPPLMFN